jgi:AP-3 complex subunit delta-1
MFTEDPDQNLKYLGLVGFVNLMHSHPRVVVEHRELVLRCLHDDDITIRTRALELLTGWFSVIALPVVICCDRHGYTAKPRRTSDSIANAR